MTTLTKFDYLLNQFEQASQAEKPADHGYAAKRKALIDYVRRLEQRAAHAPVSVCPLQDRECGSAPWHWCTQCPLRDQQPR